MSGTPGLGKTSTLPKINGEGAAEIGASFPLIFVVYLVVVVAVAVVTVAFVVRILLRGVDEYHASGIAQSRDDRSDDSGG
jgi:hypothetical protein